MTTRIGAVLVHALTSIWYGSGSAEARIAAVLVKQSEVDDAFTTNQVSTASQADGIQETERVLKRLAANGWLQPIGDRKTKWSVPAIFLCATERIRMHDLENELVEQARQASQRHRMPSFVCRQAMCPERGQTRELADVLLIARQPDQSDFRCECGMTLTSIGLVPIDPTAISDLAEFRRTKADCFAAIESCERALGARPHEQTATTDTQGVMFARVEETKKPEAIQVDRHGLSWIPEVDQKIQSPSVAMADIAPSPVSFMLSEAWRPEPVRSEEQEQEEMDEPWVQCGDQMLKFSHVTEQHLADMTDEQLALYQEASEQNFF